MKKNKFVIVGAGSSYTPAIVAVLLARRDDLKLQEIALYDIDADRVARTGRFCELYAREHAQGVQVSYTTEIETAFHGADFLFVQIRPGCNQQREQDEKIPLRHGILGQETCGLGGFSFALRCIPAILEIVGKAQEICPDAWILNYSNPEAMISEAIYRTYPHAKALCICDMPISQEETIADFLGIPHKDLTFKYFGLNHFGWFTNIYDKEGRDLLPALRERVLSDPSVRLVNAEAEEKHDNYWGEMYAHAIEGFRAYPEFFPLVYLSYYYFHNEMVAHMDPGYTRANYVLDVREKVVFDDCERCIAAGTTKDSALHAGVHGNYIVDIANAIINNTHERFIINTMNRGAIGNFNHDAVVEVPCYVSAGGIEPVSVGYIPQFHKSLMEAQKGYEKLAVEAALTGSYQKALQAVLLNRTVPSYAVGKAVLDELMEANQGYWPALK